MSARIVVKNSGVVGMTKIKDTVKKARRVYVYCWTKWHEKNKANRCPRCKGKAFIRLADLR